MKFFHKSVYDFGTPRRFHLNGNDSGILSHVGKDIQSNLLSIGGNLFESFSV